MPDAKDLFLRIDPRLLTCCFPEFANVTSTEPPFDVDFLIGWCAHKIAGGLDYASYDAASRDMLGLLSRSAKDRAANDAALHRSVGLCLTRAIWRKTPHPGHRFAPAPLPATERNAPCPCGSLQKYKHCCLPLERDVPLEAMNFLPLVLDALPKQRWSELVGSRIDPDLVAHAADEWIRDGRSKDAMMLLDPWFADDGQFVARNELLFDLLLDIYTDLHKPRKKATLLDRAMRHGDRTLRSAAMQRRVSILADQGDMAAAWKLFGEAQRHDPESPALSNLEVTLLLGEGREAEARERARFWVLRFERRRDPELADLIGLLRGIANDGGGALLAAIAADDPELSAFIDAVRDLPPITVQYELQPHHDSAGPLRPSHALAAALRAWDATFLPRSPDDDPWETALAWLALLRDKPMLWSAFEVIEQLCHAIDDLELPVTQAPKAKLLERGEQLLRNVIDANGANGLKLEWGWHENRPALGVLASYCIDEALGPMTAKRLTTMEWLVHVLNPNDNQGIRDLLLEAYFDAERFDDALALVERYPDDLAPMQYGRALALFAKGQPGQALGALHGAKRAWPKTYAWLLKTNPKPPRHGRYGVEIGGDEEAWIYRQSWLPIWQRLGALEWARSLDRSKR